MKQQPTKMNTFYLDLTDLLLCRHPFLIRIVFCIIMILWSPFKVFCPISKWKSSKSLCAATGHYNKFLINTLLSTFTKKGLLWSYHCSLWFHILPTLVFTLLKCWLFKSKNSLTQTNKKQQPSTQFSRTSKDLWHSPSTSPCWLSVSYRRIFFIFL